MTSSGDRIRIGTRGSALARWQADHVASALEALDEGLEIETVLIKTEGDIIQDIPLSKARGKAFFTKEIEAALIRDQVDLAVHSLKDLATEMPPGLELGAVMEREDPRDAIVLAEGMGGPSGDGEREGRGVGLDDLPSGTRVGTSSLRRRALMARWRPDLELLDIRGNVPTRIRKLDDGGFDAIVLAAAGVKRLGLAHRISGFLPLATFLPAVSQGAIGIQIRRDDRRVRRWVERLDHEETRFATTAERAFLRRVEGGCQVPVGALGRREAKGLRLEGVICSLDGTRWVEGERSGSPGEAAGLGLELAEELLGRGGKEILAEIRGSDDATG